MVPKIPDLTSWQQAEQLFQPAFIRILDNIRQALEQSAWQGNYVDVYHWPPGTTGATKAQVLLLQQQMEAASPQEKTILEAKLGELPTPQPGYQLQLKRASQEIQIDLWDLCYQVCFQHYRPGQPEAQTVAIDTSLLETTGDVDWRQLDDKVKQVIAQVFGNLPLAEP